MWLDPMRNKGIRVRILTLIIAMAIGAGMASETPAALAAANITQYGADPSGNADSTTAIREAVASGEPVYVPKGSYLVTDMITLNNGQLMYGDDRATSTLLVNSNSFNLSALGVVRLATLEPGASLRDIGITFVQPDQPHRAKIVPFPPAIYAQEAPRFQLTRVRVSGANVCLDARGNSGGAQIDDFECGALTAGMLWGSPPGTSNNGAKDFVHIRDYHFWNFGIPTSSQLWNVFHDSSTVSASLGEIDGLDASGMTLFAGTIEFTPDANHGWYAITNLMCDDLASLVIQGAKFLQISNVYVGSPGSLSVSGGETMMTNAWIGAGGQAAVPAVRVSGGELSVQNGWFNMNNPAQSFASVTGGMLRIKDTNISPIGARFTAPYIAQSGNGFLVVENSEF